MTEQKSNPQTTTGAELAVEPSRVPDFSGRRARLQADPIKGYHLCWVNDTPGNIPEHLAMGYQFVEQKEQPRFADPARTAGKGDDVGTKCRVYVGAWLESGEPTYAYLMKVPELLFNEGMRKLDERNAAVRADIERRVKGGQVPGESNFYSSKGNSIKESRSPT